MIRGLISPRTLPAIASLEIFLHVRTQVARQSVHRPYDIANLVEHGVSRAMRSSTGQPLANHVGLGDLALERLRFDVGSELVGQSNGQRFHGHCLYYTRRNIASISA